MRVVGYVRVSTGEQATEGVSLAAQEHKIRLFCQLHNLELVAIVTDAGESGKTIERPGLKRVLAMFDAGEAGGIVVAKLDRLTRSVRDLDTLLSGYFGDGGGQQLFSVADSIDTRTAAGRLVLNVLMSVAQWERETIVERTNDAISHKRRKGERVGPTPFGYDLAEDGKTLVANQVEQAALDFIVKARQDGTPLRRIAAELDSRGIKPKTGAPKWRHSSIVRIIDRIAPPRENRPCLASPPSRPESTTCSPTSSDASSEPAA